MAAATLTRLLFLAYLTLLTSSQSALGLASRTRVRLGSCVRGHTCRLSTRRARDLPIYPTGALLAPARLPTTQPRDMRYRAGCDDGATTVGVLGTRLSAFLCAWLVVAGGLPVKATRCEQVARLTSRDHWLAMSFFHALRAPLAAHNLVRAAPIHPRRTSLPERLRYPLDRTLFTLCHPLPTDTMRIECPMHKGCARTRPLSRSIGFPATWHGAPLRAIPTSTLRPHPDGCTTHRPFAK